MKITGRQITLTAIAILLSFISFSQRKSATVSGKVVDENENPMPNVSVVILGRQTGITTNDSGYFKLKVPAERAFAIVFSLYRLPNRTKEFPTE